MSSYKLSLNITEINRAAEQAFVETAFQFGAAMTRVISEPRSWAGWDDTRDIVDTGQLRSSQLMVFNNPFEAAYSWNVAYTAYVHEGFTRRDGTRVAGRPWTVVAQQEFDIQEVYAAAYQKYINS